MAVYIGEGQVSGLEAMLKEEAQRLGMPRAEQYPQAQRLNPPTQLGRQAMNQAPLRGHLDEIGKELERLEQYIVNLSMIRDRLLGSRPQEVTTPTLDHPVGSIDDHLRMLRVRLSDRLTMLERILVELDTGI